MHIGRQLVVGHHLVAHESMVRRRWTPDQDFRPGVEHGLSALSGTVAERDNERASTPFGYVRKDTAMTNRLNVIELLERDHRMIDQLAEQLDDADDPSEIRRLFLRIVEELSAHEAAEQEVLFPAFRSMVDASSDHTLDHRMGEHEELNELLAEMRTLPPDGFAFVKRGSALLLFQIEEETVFERMRAALTADQLAELGGRAVIAKQHCPAFPHDHPKVAGQTTH
jgi:hypothetical protein